MPRTLKYLFVAEFVDGSFLKQTPDDISKLDPEKRSQFYDVLQSGKKVRRFSLVGAGNTITVDLGTGIFNVNGLPILLESKKLPTLPDHFELIFYRQWTEDLNVTYDLHTGKALSQELQDSFCEYFIGWKCNINGKEYQQKLGVS